MLYILYSGLQTTKNMTIRKVILRTFLLAIMLAGSPLLAAPATLENVRFWNAPDHTRIVFDISRQVKYRLFSLQNPERVVIDIQQADWRGGQRPELLESGYVRSLRSALQKDQTLRLVLDTDRKTKPRSFLLKPNQQYGHRLVVDLYQHEKGPIKAVKTVRDQADEGFRDVVIAIDAGHGGEDPGAIGIKGTKEKYITMAVAKKLAAVINKQQGMKAVLIREGDYYLRLRKRIEKARKHRADLFVSLHADAFRKSYVNGSSVYILSEGGASSEAARWLAMKENDSDLVGGVTLDDKDDLLATVLLDLSQSATIEASADLAQMTLKQLKRVGKVHRRHVERAGFAVLKSPDIPSILVELAFISNPTEEKNLNSRNHQQKIANAIAKGLKIYFNKRPPDNTLFAAKTHTIKRGDTLSELAHKYETSPKKLKSTNGLNTDILRIGQVLRIPSRGS